MDFGLGGLVVLDHSSAPDAPPDSHEASAALPYLSCAGSSYDSFAGFGSDDLCEGVLTGMRGPFTTSQWMELEHQALICKYITANIPVPSNLLIPIKRALDSVGFSCSLGGYLISSPSGWGSFHLGFSNTGDPEPGRCRRTDGKKWRCSRDAVADQKYCEKHMNRGRHRSRKPVEGQNGHPMPGTTTAAYASSRKTPVVKTASAAAGALAAVVPGCGGLDSLATIAQHQQQMKSLHPSVLSADSYLKRSFAIQESNNDEKQNPTVRQSPYEDSSRQQFTHDNSYSLFDGLDNNSSLLDSRGYASSQDLSCTREFDTPCGSPYQFIDNWPENSVNQSAASWSDTSLSISIPMASSNLVSTISSPTNQILPLRLLQKSDPFHMNLRVIHSISRGSSIGGPLGEVLNQNDSTASNNADSKKSSLLHPMTDGWDNSPLMGSSPRGVLQKTTFRTLSNSSGRSSPCPENNKYVNGINEHLGSTFVNPVFSLPAL